MAQNAGPLTTIFTPPPSCTDIVTSAGGSLYIGHWADHNADSCYPSSTNWFDYGAGHYYWSPGVCPEGFTTACHFTDVKFANTAISASVCCPQYVFAPRSHIN
jgi:hypothetical protein